MAINRSRPPTTHLFPFTLEQLADPATYADVLTRVGTSDIADVAHAATWPEAMAHCEASREDGLMVEAMNEVGRRVQRIDYNLYNLWNIFAMHSKPRLAEIAEQHIMPRLGPDANSRLVIDRINWIIVGATIERCYAIVGVIEPMWATRWCQLVVDGYFPCGWEGEFPRGRLIVF